MTVKELSQLRYLRLEKTLLKKDIADLDRRIAGPMRPEREA